MLAGRRALICSSLESDSVIPRSARPNRSGPAESAPTPGRVQTVAAVAQGLQQAMLRCCATTAGRLRASEGRRAKPGCRFHRIPIFYVISAGFPQQRTNSKQTGRGLSVTLSPAVKFSSSSASRPYILPAQSSCCVAGTWRGEATGESPGSALQAQPLARQPSAMLHSQCRHLPRFLPQWQAAGVEAQV